MPQKTGGSVDAQRSQPFVVCHVAHGPRAPVGLEERVGAARRRAHPLLRDVLLIAGRVVLDAIRELVVRRGRRVDGVHHIPISVSHVDAGGGLDVLLEPEVGGGDRVGLGSVARGAVARPQLGEVLEGSAVGGGRLVGGGGGAAFAPDGRGVVDGGRVAGVLLDSSVAGGGPREIDVDLGLRRVDVVVADHDAVARLGVGLLRGVAGLRRSRGAIYAGAGVAFGAT